MHIVPFEFLKLFSGLGVSDNDATIYHDFDHEAIIVWVDGRNSPVLGHTNESNDEYQLYTSHA